MAGIGAVEPLDPGEGACVAARKRAGDDQRGHSGEACVAGQRAGTGGRRVELAEAMALRLVTAREVHRDRHGEQQQECERTHRSGERGRRRQQKDGDGELREREQRRQPPGDRLGYAERGDRLPCSLPIRKLADRGDREHGGQQQPGR